MKTFATILSAALLLITLPRVAEAQPVFEDVTINQLTALPQANIDQLNALGASATSQQINQLVTNSYISPSGNPSPCYGTTPPESCKFVRVEGVVLTDPHYSGLASVTDGIPNRVHFFIRDVAAETQGVGGMTIQVVDESQSGAALNLLVGDIVEIEGFVTIFGNGAQRVWQFNPMDGASIDVIGFADPNNEWLQPVSVTTADINKVVDVVSGEPVVQANWDNFNSLSGQYVRVEGAQITNSDQNESFGRPRFAFASIGHDERVVSYDVSLRYRIKCGSGGADAPFCYDAYPNPPFFSRPAEDPFIAPHQGAVINIQGFLVFGPISDFFNVGQPPQALWYLSPITDDDLEVTVIPPVIALEGITEVPTGPFEVFATVVSGSGDPLTDVDLHYEYTSGASGVIGMQPASGENRFSATIPATSAEDGAFVSYFVYAKDAGGLDNTSAPRHTRVLFGGITQIEHIQRTWNDGAGPGPFTNISTTMNIEAVVMTDPSVPDIISIQDDPDRNPWTGVFLMYNEGLATQLEKGDIIQISQATIRDGGGAPAFNMTRLEVTMDHITVVGNQSPYPHITGLPTGLFAQDPAIAESYEGMAVRFDDVTITDPNPDNAPFSEFAFSSDGTQANQLRGRTQTFDASQHPELDPGHLMFEGGEHVEFIQGIMGFTHGNYKLLPQSPDDFGTITVDSESTGTAHSITLESAYPNPVASQATINYTLARSGQVRLEVFDVTGRRVAVLVDTEQTAGRQDATLDARQFASGVYFVRLVADGEVRTTRVVITR